MERDKLIGLLLQNFLKALFESLKPIQSVEEKVNYLETLIAYLKGVYNHKDPFPELNYEGNPFDSESYIRKNILLKYKEKAKPFVHTGLRYFFEKDRDMRLFLFDRLKLNESVLEETEYDEYINYVHTLLHNLIEKICISSFETAKAETENELKTLPENTDEISGFKSKSKEYSRSRQILLYYFVLKLLGKSRIDTPLIKLAEFGHVLFAWPTDNANNNAVYKMLKDAPYLKKDSKAMLLDLEFIKKQFESIEHAEGIALVQKEINSLKGK